LTISEAEASSVWEHGVEVLLDLAHESYLQVFNGGSGDFGGFLASNDNDTSVAMN
jgi:hypothetical protein